MTSSFFVIFISILLSAFFSGMEIAFISSNRIHIEIEKRQSGWISSILAKLTSKPSKFIAAMLIGNNLALVVYGFVMGDVLMNWFQSFLPSENRLLTYLLEDAVLVSQTVFSTLLILITAEFLPKVVFQIYSNQLLKFFALPAFIFYQLFAPISSFVIWISDVFFKKIFKISDDQIQLAFSKVDLGHYISEQLNASETKEDIDTEIQIFQNALEFSEVKSREVMIPRTELMAISVHESIDILTNKFVESGFSKILVFNNTVDDILGYVHSFDLFKRPANIKSILKPVELVPETMLIKDVMNVLTKKRRSIAVVLDEYGGTSGIMTIEDIVEELFGEIEDEHDSTDLIEEKISEGRFKFSARLDVDYINEQYELKLPENENYETLGGMIVQHVEGIPEKNTQVLINGFVIDVLEVSNTKIDLITITIAEDS
jgi:CBS domain containing-hemolysin-like protein